MISWKRKKLFSQENESRFNEYIKGLCATEQMQRLREFDHHKQINRYDHVLLVSFLSFALARRWGWDDKAAARAGLLHDLFWTECDGTVHLCIHHPETACANAEALTGGLTKKERNIILSHMWPAGRHLPRCREAWMVDLVDTFVTVLDLTNRSQKYNRMLAEAVPAIN